MPYIKPKQPPFAKLTRLLRGYGFDGPSLGKVLGCSHPTAKKKIDNPELLTLAELKKINQAGHIPAEEIREAIGF